jgi:hypothetical protein
VQIHPVSSLVGLIAWQLSASKEARMDQPTQELHLCMPANAQPQREAPSG